ncbi:unnamed protein product [Toxocara canis]|uniref:ANK_REP_REGION domain-containing protein n=1 Tax=Toxocara canis TaxID=6265 RepID=A0A183U1B1_TOXCA|nr:unnamed protein product [Toxocara canis]
MTGVSMRRGVRMTDVWMRRDADMAGVSMRRCVGMTGVFEELLSAGMKWYSEDEGGAPRSRSVEQLACAGHFEMLNLLSQWDAESYNPKLHPIEFMAGNEYPLAGAVECWIRSAVNFNQMLRSWGHVKRTGWNRRQRGCRIRLSCGVAAE